MVYKSRTESAELLVLGSLNTRMNLSDKDKQHYFNLKKGYQGEVLFDSFIEKLQCECLILNDLLLKVNNTLFQIDSLIITSDKVYFYEVKNFDGDYYYESDRLYKKPKFEINNPLNQLSRSESLLRQLLHHLGLNIPIDASVVFIHPEFTLYQSPLNKPFIFPTQINHYLKKLNTISSKLNEKQKMLADKLISLHIEESPFKQLPPYDYDHLEKGITCPKCNSFLISVEGGKCICRECGHEEAVATAVIRSVEELKRMFPNLKITTNVIHEWCKVVESKQRIRKILEKNYKMVGVHQWSFYE